MANAGKIVLVTGATGFLGSTIVDVLLDQGYSVRAVGRGRKADKLKEIYADNKRVEVLSIDDVATSQFPDAFGGLYGVIHAAAPLAGRQTPEESFKSAIEGTLNVVRQAEKAGVTRIVVTGSLTAATTPTYTFKETDWNPVTKEEAIASGDKMAVYSASKKYSELALWEWAKEHPHVEVATVVPSMLLGPWGKGFFIDAADYGALAGDIAIYNLITPDGDFLQYGAYIDTRDIAKVHVLLLNAPPTAEVGQKRVILSSPHEYEYAAILKFIAEERPALKERLIKGEPPQLLMSKLTTGAERVQKLTGLGAGDFQPLKSTILGAIDALLKVEADWVAKGTTIKVPSPNA